MTIPNTWTLNLSSLKRELSLRSGNIHHRQDPKRYDRWAPRLRWCCWLSFLTAKKIVHNEYAPGGQTITKLCYLKVLQRFRDAVHRKRLDLSQNLKLHHGNAPAQLSQLFVNFLVKKGIPVIRQAPYSPDMVPSDFWLFPKIKQQLKGFRFQSQDDIISFHQTSLRPASNSGSIAGWSVWMLKEPILKEIRTVCNLCDCLQYNCTLYRNYGLWSDTF